MNLENETETCRFNKVIIIVAEDFCKYHGKHMEFLGVLKIGY